LGWRGRTVKAQGRLQGFAYLLYPDAVSSAEGSIFECRPGRWYGRGPPGPARIHLWRIYGWLFPVRWHPV